MISDCSGYYLFKYSSEYFNRLLGEKKVPKVPKVDI